jgi:hypothetical protein
MEPESSLPHSQVPAICLSLLSQPNPVHNPTFYFLKINLNIITLSTPESPQWSLFPQISPPKLCTRFSPPVFERFEVYLYVEKTLNM